MRTQQGHPRLAREARHHLADDPLHQRRLFQPLGETAEAQPGFQLVRQLAVVDQVFQLRDHQLGLLADRADQRRQRMFPAIVAIAQ